MLLIMAIKHGGKPGPDGRMDFGIDTATGVVTSPLRMVRLQPSVWCDMGRPYKLKITIQPVE